MQDTFKELKFGDFNEIKKINPLEYLADEKNVELAVLECLYNEDPEGVKEIINIYLEAKKISQSRSKCKASDD